jgi:ABC-type transport system involved in multi-copper enzyme maturation permease subunit
MNHPILIVMRLTFLEALRRKIAQAGLIMGVLFIILFSIGFDMITASMYPQASEAQRNILKSESYNILTLMGLYAVAFMSVAMSTLVAADTLAGEVTSGTVQSILTKPVRRSDVVIGKWLGTALLLLVYILLVAGGVVLSVFLQSGYMVKNLAVGLLYIYMEGLVVASVALMFGSRLSALATGGIVFGLYGIAFVGGWVEHIGALLQNQASIHIGIISSLIMPSEALWRRAAFEMQSAFAGGLMVTPFNTFSVPSPAMIVYSAFYLIGLVVLTLRFFLKRDL